MILYHYIYVTFLTSGPWPNPHPNPVGADGEAALEDFDGRTPYAIACERGHHEVVAVLDWWLSEEPEKVPTDIPALLKLMRGELGEGMRT